MVTDNAAYCLKAYWEVLKGVMPNSVHVTCLCHVINLVAETWQHYKYFCEVASFGMAEICPLQKACQREKIGELLQYEREIAGLGSSEAVNTRIPGLRQ